MRKIIFGINLTLDGFFDHTAMIADEELHARAAELFRRADLVIFGRKMYQLMAEYWPTAAADGSLSPAEKEFADAINAAEKIVVSKTLDRAGWKTRILRSVDPAEISAMKAAPGRDILLGGGAELAQTFMELGLIDEYRFSIHPVLLGKGEKLFRVSDQRKVLQLVSRQELHSGVVELIYHPVPEAAGRG